MSLPGLLIPVIALLQPASPKVGVALHAAHASIAPGGQTELAVEIDVEKDWHLYHPILLDTGVPTAIRFEVPPGVTLGPLRFPAPRFGQQHDAKYLALEGRFSVLTTLSLAADAPLEPLAVRAEVSGLACKELCVFVRAGAALTLDVAPVAGRAVQDELFRAARAALPAPLAQAPYLEGSSVAITRSELGVGEEAEIVVALRVQKGHHIQDRDPGNELLIPSRLLVETLDGVRLGPQKWPEPKVVSTPFFGKVRELRDALEIRAPLKLIDEQFPAGPVALRVLFTYQCCSDAGTCYPPQAAEDVVHFTARTPTPGPADARPRGSLLPEVAVVAAPARPPAAPAAPAARQVDAARLLWHLLLGFVGGLLLNVMPCVFPVISLKVLSFVKQAGEDRGRVLRLGLAFCAGILIWFWIFGILTGLGKIPWQHPPVVIALTAILFLFALNLLGVFEITLPGSAAGRLEELASREGYGGALAKGFLATLLGTACTAPAFASAAAYAATQPTAIALVIFTGAGLGMSSPYLVLAALPGWLRLLPRPGPWMVTFKQAMGFVLIGTCVWLLLTVGDLLDARGVVWTVGFLAFLGVAAWLLGRTKLSWSRAARLSTWGAAAATVALGAWFCFVVMYDPQAARRAVANPGPVFDEATLEQVAAAAATADWSEGIPWQPFITGLPEALARRGHTVFVDFTATWCITCQTNKKTSLEIDSIRQKMRAAGVIPLKADYTKADPEIRRILAAYGHNSVPLNLVYPAGRPADAIQLPVVLTPGAVAKALDAAGPSTHAPGVAGRAALSDFR